MNSRALLILAITATVLLALYALAVYDNHRRAQARQAVYGHESREAPAAPSP